MPVPGVGSVGQTARKLAMPAVFAGFAVMGGVSGYKERVRKGQNPIMSALIEGALIAPQFLLSPLAFNVATFGMPLARASASAVIGAVRDHNNFIRQAKTPFSHRFEHSDVSARAQAAGLRQIGSAVGHARMGAEAASFASRYGR